MAIITEALVRLNAVAESKEDAIKMAGDLLVQAGRVAPAYVEGMLARERTMSTYMGNGVAIPHGEFENREDIYETGISVVQIPAGIVWEDEERAYLVIGIAAKADEHITVLSNLAEVVEAEENVAVLVQTTDPQIIIERLDRPVAEE